MAQDIRELFQKEQKNETQANLPAGHEARFLKKLDAEFSKTSKTTWSWWYIAASIVVVLGVGFGTFKYFQVPENIQVVDTPTDTESNKGEIPTRTLGDISPDLKKVEDYYLANINFELSKVTLTPENKDLIDGYLTQLETLNQEYKRISLELTHSLTQRANRQCLDYQFKVSFKPHVPFKRTTGNFKNNRFNQKTNKRIKQS